jgi:hypothetical protein
VSIADERHKLIAFFQEFFSKIFLKEFKVKETTPHKLYLLICQKIDSDDQEGKDFLNASKRTLYHWSELIEVDYIQNFDDFEDLLTHRIPKVLEAATLAFSDQYPEFFSRLEKVLINWKKVFNEH